MPSGVKVAAEAVFHFVPHCLFLLFCCWAFQGSKSPELGPVQVTRGKERVDIA